MLLYRKALFPMDFFLVQLTFLVNYTMIFCYCLSSHLVLQQGCFPLFLSIPHLLCICWHERLKQETLEVSKVLGSKQQEAALGLELSSKTSPGVRRPFAKAPFCQLVPVASRATCRINLLTAFEQARFGNSTLIPVCW